MSNPFTFPRDADANTQETCELAWGGSCCEPPEINQLNEQVFGITERDRKLDYDVRAMVRELVKQGWTAIIKLTEQNRPLYQNSILNPMGLECYFHQGNVYVDYHSISGPISKYVDKIRLLNKLSEERISAQTELLQLTRQYEWGVMQLLKKAGAISFTSPGFRFIDFTERPVVVSETSRGQNVQFVEQFERAQKPITWSTTVSPEKWVEKRGTLE